MKKAYLWLLAAILWFLISIVLLTLPGTAFPTEDWLDKIWFDKWVHIGMFSIMVVLWCLAWKSLKGSHNNGQLLRTFWIMAIIFLAYGIGMEFVQKYFIPYRSFDFSDIAADAIGCLIGVIYSRKKYIKDGGPI